MKKKKKTNKRLFILLLIMAIFGAVIALVMFNPGLNTSFKTWWTNHNKPADEGGDDETPPPEAEPQCPRIFGKGQDCSSDPDCCERGTACSGNLRMECEYIYPICTNIFPADYELGNYTYEDIVRQLKIYETYYSFYDFLNGNNNLHIDYAYEATQCMSNHPEYIDFCCKCPDGTSTRFVWLPTEQIQYMWCFPNPN
jgi:hypothetical protein